MDVAAFLLVWARAFIEVLGTALIAVIFVRVLISWIQVRLPGAVAEIVFPVSEAILGPIRRSLPAMGGFDFSPFIALIAIQIVQGILLRLLPYPV